MKIQTANYTSRTEHAGTLD